MSLPTKEKYEDLKEKRKQEQEKRLEQERLVRFCDPGRASDFPHASNVQNISTLLPNRQRRKL